MRRLSGNGKRNQKGPELWRCLSLAALLGTGFSVAPLSAEETKPAEIVSPAPVIHASAASKPAPATSEAEAATEAAAENTAAAAKAAADPFKERIDFAYGLYKRGMYDLAIEEYRAIVRDFLDHPEAHQAVLGEAENLFSLKKHAEALVAYRAYLVKYPDNPSRSACQKRIGESLFYLGQTEEAVVIFKKLVSDADLAITVLAKYYLGKIAYDAKSWDEAESRFKEVAASPEAERFSAYSNLYLGQILLKRSKAGEALLSFEACRRSDQPDVRQLGWFGSGEALFELERFAEAAEAFKSAYNEGPDPDLADTSRMNYLNAIFRTGDTARFEAEYPAVVEALRDAKKKAEILVTSAKLLTEAGRFSDSQALLERAEALAPQDTAVALSVFEGRLQNKVSEEKPEEVLQMLQSKLLEEREASPRLTLLEAEALKKIGKADEAAGKYRAFLDRYPQSEWAPEAEAGLMYLELERGGTDEAERVARKFLIDRPDHELAEKISADLVILDFKKKDYAAAIRDTEGHLARYPQGGYAAKTALRQAMAVAETGERAKAEGLFVRYFERYPDLAGEDKDYAAFQAGWNAQSDGHYDAALGWYRKVESKGAEGRELKAQTLKNAAFSAVNAGKLEEAAEAYWTLLTGFPDEPVEPEAVFWLADFLAEKSDAGRLLEVVNRFASTPSAGAHAPELAFYRAEAHRLRGEEELALVSYDVCAASKSAYRAEALFGKAVILKGRGAAAEALELLNQAVREAGGQHELGARARFEIAETLKIQKNYIEAGKAYLSVAILYDDERWVPEALLEAGRAFELAGESAKAASAYQELTERFPQHPGVAESRTRLGKLGS